MAHPQEKPLQKIAIVGGGLGGLYLAQCLRDSGKEVTIYERDEGTGARHQGWFIGVSLPRLRKAPHLTPFFQAQSRIMDGFVFKDANLKHICTLPMPSKHAATALVSRFLLRDELTKGVNVQWGKQFTRYDEDKDGVTLWFEDGTSARADFLVGADGLRSRVRAQRCPSLEMMDTGFVSVGSFIPALPKEHCPIVSSLIQEQSNMVRVVSSQRYSLLLGSGLDHDGEPITLFAFSYPRDDSIPLDDSGADRAAIQARIAQRGKEVFGGNPELCYIFDQLLANDREIYGPRPIRCMKYTQVNPLEPSGRVTLMGDALHAMTTHRGMGANTAFFDAADLAEALCADDWRAALVKCEATMFKRGMDNVKGSLQSTEMNHAKNQFIRNMLLRVVSTVLWVLISLGIL
ncbi:uncharacterized protein VTP21DRAFT_4849 [Calcarisporiella thermophila]|uniref:uncharacterized protein n=1 Tax=Calcarisporiella thermophila TaxID=911321 RepID=UPI0037427054